MAKRGILAEMQRAARNAARESERRNREAQRLHAARVRAAEQACLAGQRAAAAAARATESERKQLEKEAKAAHVAAAEADVAARNAQIEAMYDELDNLLAATLEVDDHVDLETLRRRAEHPAPPRTGYDQARAHPTPIQPSSPPPAVSPDLPRGRFSKRSRDHLLEVASEFAYANAHARWEMEIAGIPDRNRAAAETHAMAEATRVANRERALAGYRQECAARDAEAQRHNADLDVLITGLGYGTAEAIQEYVGIVMANSVYPDVFPVEHTFTFDPASAELTLRCSVIGPGAFPTMKSWRYVKASDEIVSADTSQKGIRERYASAIAQVALRTVHEVFESDRRGLIRTVSLEVGTETNHPATGVVTFIPLLAVGVQRETFMGFDLSAVVPAATLAHLGAAMSKNPWALTPVDAGGVRRS